MDKIKRYVECYIPITTCNLKCHYCYITRQRKWKDGILPIGHTPNEIRKVCHKNGWERIILTYMERICKFGDWRDDTVL